MEENKCDICDQNFTNKMRKKIKCPYCEKISCVFCFQNFLIKSESITPKCMFCFENFSYWYIRENCSYNFCNKDLHLKRTEVETKRQLSLLPNTQNLANLEKERRNYFLEIELYNNKIAELKREIEIVKRQRRNVPWPTLQDIDENNQKITFIQKCPIEDCRGFLNNNWKCGICQTYICKRCLVPKLSRNDNNHFCDEQTVTSISLIKKDSKPCPKCGDYIFKIEGCDQMWCPGCKTAFSWRTGMIDKGTVHNPHYFEYMRNLNDGVIPRQPGDLQPCDAVPDYQTIWLSSVKWNKNNNFVRDITREINNFVRYRNHFERTLMPQVNINYQEKYTNLRIKYLLKDIKLNDLKQEISKIIKKEEKDSQILEIYNVFYLVTGEILININEMLNNNTDPDTIVEEIEKTQNIKKYCNDKLKIISDVFKNKVKLINK